MTDESRYDQALGHDWGDVWEALEPAPSLVLTRPNSAQLTLRVPGEMITALKEIAHRKALPYHAMARSWIVERLRQRILPSGADEANALGSPGDTQLNIKLTPELLDELKTFSDETRRPYHRLVRLWLEADLRHELEAVAPSSPARNPSLGELMVLLLDTPGPGSGNAAVRGITRLQKLLFVIEKRLAADPSRFYAYNYGPFDEQVNDAADALQVKGLIQSSARAKATPPTVDDMMSSVLRHAGPHAEPETFVLTENGRSAAEQLRRSSEAYADLAKRIAVLRQEWDRPDLIERVYDAFPEYTGRSLIKDEISSRTVRRGGRSR